MRAVLCHKPGLVPAEEELRELDRDLHRCRFQYVREASAEALAALRAEIPTAHLRAQRAWGYRIRRTQLGSAERS